MTSAGDLSVRPVRRPGFFAKGDSGLGLLRFLLPSLDRIQFEARSSSTARYSRWSVRSMPSPPLVCAVTLPGRCRYAS